ncbi:hypothetical protein ACHMW5_35945 (plasmid) [Azospirillum melinis]|uniref:hypothetical protein n=1 Tax=Azospirillum melinis TaxID=328839 RepID=UPI003756B087
MQTDDHLVTTKPAPIGATDPDWTHGQADAEAGRPADRSGSAAYWRGYIAACFGDNRHG